MVLLVTSGAVAKAPPFIAAALCMVLLVTSVAVAKAPPFEQLSKAAVLSGKFAAEDHPELRKRGPFYIRGDVWERYKALKACARDPACSGLKRPMGIVTCSMFRGYRQQKNRWLGEMKERRGRFRLEIDRVDNILRYLALPGTSRHHWGTEVDLAWNRQCMMSNHQYMSAEENTRRCDRSNARCLAKGISPKICRQRDRFCWRRVGPGVKFYNWLRDNAGRFGFCQPYKGYPEERHGPLFTRGYEPERWHWSSCCEARRNLNAIAKLLDQVVPPPADVFGRQPMRIKGKREALMEVHQTVVVDAVRQHIFNIHAECLTCAVDCGD